MELFHLSCFSLHAWLVGFKLFSVSSPLVFRAVDATFSLDPVVETLEQHRVEQLMFIYYLSLLHVLVCLLFVS